MFDDESDSASRAEQPHESDTKASPYGFIQQDQPTQRKQESTSDKSHADNTPKPVFPVRAWQWLVNWWTDPYRPRGNFPEHLTVIVSIVVAVIAGFQWSVYRQQKQIMESSGQQTQQLIVAANIQADAAKRNATAAESFSTSAIKIQDRIRLAETDFSEIANNANKSLRATQESFRADQRAWMGVVYFKADISDTEVLTVGGSVVLKNMGKTPALHMSGRTLSITLSGQAPVPDFDQEYERFRKYNERAKTSNPSYADTTKMNYFSGEEHSALDHQLFPDGMLCPPGTEMKVTIMAGETFTKPELFRTHSSVIYVLGKITYDDIFQNNKHTTKFCAMYAGDNILQFCPGSNSSWMD
jgi:hypothetical protein